MDIQTVYNETLDAGRLGDNGITARMVDCHRDPHVRISWHCPVSKRWVKIRTTNTFR